MTGPQMLPDWAAEIPSAPIHPGQGGTWQAPMSPFQMVEFGLQLIEQFLRRVVNAVVGFFIPGGGAAFDQLAAWGQSANNGLQNLATLVTGINFAQPPGEVWADIVEAFLRPLNVFAELISGLINAIHIPQLDPTKILNLPGLFTTAQNTINAIVAGFTGLLGGGWGTVDAEAAARAVAQQQADTAASVAKLQQLNSANAQGGNSGFVDFTNLPDASSLGSSFSQTYSGTGTDLLGIVSGRGVVTPGTSTAGRVCNYVYTPKQTLTDYQRVSAVFATTPGKSQYGPPFALQDAWGYNRIRARIAESGTYAGVDCVMVIFTQRDFYLGCVASGVWTQWAQITHAFRPGAIYSLDAGSTGGDRQYRVLVNGANLHVHNEVGTVSHKGSGYRATGGGGEWEVDFDGTSYFRGFPSALAAFYMADNAPPEMLSSLGRAFRASASSVSFPSQSTEYAIPNNFFDTLDYATADLTWAGTPGTWTVSRRGNYLVTVNLTADLVNQVGVPILYVNGVRTAIGNTGSASTLAYFSPLNPGDELKIKYFTYSSSVGIGGGPGGESGFFQVARITPDNLEDISA